MNSSANKHKGDGEMYNEERRKQFTQPLCEVIHFDIRDMITTSGNGSKDDWGLGEFGEND